MKKIYIITILLASIGFIQCKNEQSNYAPINQPTNPHHQNVDVNKPFYYGSVVEKLDAGGYSYLKVAEQIKHHDHQKSENTDHHFWIAVEASPVKIGEEIRFQKEMVTQKFKSKILDKTFDELMFASNLQYKIK